MVTMLEKTTMTDLISNQDNKTIDGPVGSAGGFVVSVNDITEICPEDGLSALLDRIDVTVKIMPANGAHGTTPAAMLSCNISSCSMADLADELRRIADEITDAYAMARDAMSEAHPDWKYPD